MSKRKLVIYSLLATTVLVVMLVWYLFDRDVLQPGQETPTTTKTTSPSSNLEFKATFDPAAKPAASE